MAQSRNPFDDGTNDGSPPQRAPSSSALSFPEARGARRSTNPFSDDEDDGEAGASLPPLPPKSSGATTAVSQWNAQMQALREMGFTDVQRNTDALRVAEGDLARAIEHIVAGRPRPQVPVSAATTAHAPVPGPASVTAPSSTTVSKTTEQLMRSASRMADQLTRFLNTKGDLSETSSFKKQNAPADPDTVPDTVLRLVDDDGYADGDDGGGPADPQQGADLQMDEFIFDNDTDSIMNHITVVQPPPVTVAAEIAQVATPMTPTPSRPPRRQLGPPEPELPAEKDSVGSELTGLHARVAEQQGMVDSLLQENQMLRKKLAHLREGRLYIQSASETVDLMIQGQPYMMDHIKSLHEKIEMLDHAEFTHDPFAILEVALFLKRTLKPARFAAILRTRPAVSNVLIAYWKKRYEFDLIAELQTELGRTRERAMLEWWKCHRIVDPNHRLAAFERVLGVFRQDPSLAAETVYLTEQCELLRLQLNIDAVDKKFEQEDESFKKFPRQQLIGISTSKSLGYLAMYHFGAPADAQSSPLSFKKRFKIGDKAYTYTLLLMRAKLRDWNSLPQLLTTTTSMFFQTATKSCIGFEPFVRQTIRNHAPREVISFYMKQITDPWRRYQVASDIKYHDMAIEALIQLRHRSELIEYISHPELNKPVNRQYKDVAEVALRDSKIKWKTFKNR